MKGVVRNISIGAASNLDLVENRLKQELKSLECRGVRFNTSQNYAGGYRFLSYSIKGKDRYNWCEDEALALFRHCAAEILTDLILSNWLKSILTDIVRENYYYFGEEERLAIVQGALHYLDELDSGEGYSELKSRKRRKILLRIKEYLGTCDHIFIEGFIRFRLKEYIRELQEAAERAVDDFLLDREYKEFIQLLKYFVDIQEPKVERVHVLLKPNGVFQLQDGQNNVISGSFLEGCVLDLAENEISYEDMLVSTLISIAPREIIFHAGTISELPGVLETLKNIFSSRLCLCRGCGMCSKN